MFVHRPNTPIHYHPMGKTLTEVKKDCTDGILDAFDRKQKGWRSWDTDGDGKITRREVDGKLTIVLGALPPARRYEAAVALTNETFIVDAERADSRRQTLLCVGFSLLAVGLAVLAGFLAPLVAVSVVVGLSMVAATSVSASVFFARESAMTRRDGVVPARRQLLLTAQGRRPTA
jgi:hypothetical protein